MAAIKSIRLQAACDRYSAFPEVVCDGELDAVIVAFDDDPPQALRLIDQLRAGHVALPVVAATAHIGPVLDDLRRRAGYTLKYPPDVLEVLTALEGPSLAGRASPGTAAPALRRVAEARPPTAFEDGRCDVRAITGEGRGRVALRRGGPAARLTSVVSCPPEEARREVEAVRQLAECAKVGEGGTVEGGCRAAGSG